MAPLPEITILEGASNVAHKDIDASKALNLTKIREFIPKEAFEKSIIKSTGYMIWDYACWLGVTFFVYQLRHSSTWETIPFWQQTAINILFFNIAGFFMWCMFVIGHDCGHGTFSDYPLLNDILGHVTHGSILVPFYPWQLSHRRHHMYHNHITKDYSHPWYTPERFEQPDEKIAKFMDQYGWFRGLFPFFGWAVYLFGMPDGSHFFPFLCFPFSTQRMWRESPIIEVFKCLFSTSIVIAYAYGIYCFFGQDFNEMCYYHLYPGVMCGWWLVCVTYLQHHEDDTLVYDDSNWKFVDSAFETVDRKFGWGIDTLHHHITDGHVVHHLFYTKIPHYNLPIATKALKDYMHLNGLGHLYKMQYSFDFPYKVHEYFIRFGFRATPATSFENKVK